MEQRRSFVDACCLVLDRLEESSRRSQTAGVSFLGRQMEKLPDNYRFLLVPLTIPTDFFV